MPNRYKPMLSYCLHGLSDREVLLFNSFVRILNTVTRHHWRLQEEQPSGHTKAAAHLLVRQDGPGASANPPTGQAVLLVGRRSGTRAPSGGKYCMRLALPMSSDELKTCLNHLGDYLLRTHHKVGERLLQLRSWPPHTLLRAPQHLRLATLMRGQPATLSALAVISGLPEDSCAAFVRLLDEHALLQDSPQTASATGPSAALPGALTRIRQRLGMAQTRLA